MDNRYQVYKQIDVNTTNRGKIVVMLFSGAITFLNKAKMYMEKKDFENKGKYIVKAQDIVEELNISLDLEKGQEIAKNLKSIYLFVDRHLTQANIENEPQKIDNVLKILERLKSAFEEILHKPEFSEAQLINKTEQTQNCIKRFV
ncbi:MAG: flagellar export chaperone FliS [Candidatus Cloacimonetes bacterium]|nr:flagellar export chaperone FliS [Candidatus Cloacimonadota bacterium]